MDLTISCSKTSSDTDTQTPSPEPLTQPTINKTFPFINGFIKRPTSATQPPSAPSLMVVSYKECLKNHAAGIGGYAVDGCGEFMPSPTFNSSNPSSLKCAACGCHRNFHRREAKDSTLSRLYLTPAKAAGAVPPPQLQPPPPPACPAPPLRGLLSPSSSTSPSPSPSIPTPQSSPSPPPVSQFSAPSCHASAPHILLALGNSYDTAPAEEQQRRSFQQTGVKSENQCGKKRSRTKFSQEQKEKMYMFSEKLGWKMQRVEERSMQEFCKEIGVSRGVFKVWMHNNKNTVKKRSDLNLSTHSAFGDDDGSRDGLNSRVNAYNFDGNNNDIQLKQEDSSAGNLHVSPNESSP